MSTLKPFATFSDSTGKRFPLRKKLFPCAVSLLMLAQPAFAQMMAPAPTSQSAQPAMTPSSTTALKIQTGSQKVPAGTMLTIGFNTALDSRLSNVGDIFNAYLTQDFTVRGEHATRKVVLPAGTMVRGRVSEVKRPSFFSRGGAIFLAFDHVVVPSGELMPITLNLSSEHTIVNQNGAIYTDPGIGKKVERGVEAGKQTFENITESGIEAGRQIAGGLGSLITVPASVIGGAVAGGAVTTGKAVIAVVGRGDSAIIKPGDTVTIDFGGSFNLPTD